MKRGNPSMIVFYIETTLGGFPVLRPPCVQKGGLLYAKKERYARMHCLV